MRFSQANRRELEGELTPLLAPFINNDNKWVNVESANTATEIILEIMREAGIRI